MFMCINYNSDHHLNDQYGLDRNTFNFMIESDDTIKVSHSLSTEFVEDLSEADLFEVRHECEPYSGTHGDVCKNGS